MKRIMDDEKKALYVKTLLMSGIIITAVTIAKKEKSVGWSYDSNAGVVFDPFYRILPVTLKRPAPYKPF